MCNRKLILNAVVVSGGTIRENHGLFINSDGRIADIFSMSDYEKTKYPDACAFDAQGMIVTPGLIDTHIHGIGGFGTDDAKSSSIVGMSERLAMYGVTSFLPTLYAGRPDKMTKEEKAVVQAMGNETGARIMGINLEGPFLNPKKCGAQDPEGLSLPDDETFRSLIEAGNNKVVAMTIAPELEGSEKIAQIAKKENIVLLMGHTDATYEQAKEAMENGILHATHTFNAMSPMNHKAPGVAGAALMDRRMNCEVIADGVHVHSDLVMHLIDTKKDGKVVLITDSLAPASLGEGTYIANGDRVVLGKAGAFVSADNPALLCGSALTLNRAVANVVSWGADIAQAVKMATENPAGIYGFSDIGALRKGCRADIAVFDTDFNAVMVFRDGNQIYRR